ELVGNLAETRKCAEIAIHAEDAVSDQQCALTTWETLENRPRGCDIPVREYLDCRATETSAVDDARVIQFVRHDHVIASEKRGDRAGICRETTLKHHGGRCPFEGSDAAFELHVNLHRARDGPHGAGAPAKRGGGPEVAFTQSRVCRESEIVVRR